MSRFKTGIVLSTLVIRETGRVPLDSKSKDLTLYFFPDSHDHQSQMNSSAELQGRSRSDHAQETKFLSYHGLPPVRL
jgi:hypothetical protein